MTCRPCPNVVVTFYLVFTSLIATPSVSTPRIKPRELICDGYGKCRHKIADAMEKMKEAMVEVEEDAVEAVAGVKDTIADAAQAAGETTKEAVEDIVVVARRRSRAYSSIGAGHVVHLFGFATAYGTCVWFTLASGYVLGTTLSSRQQLEMVQTKLHRVYFRAMAGSVGAALFGHLVCGMEALQGFNLMASLAAIFVNFLYLEPRATKVAFERMKKKKEEKSDDEPAKAKKTGTIKSEWSEQVLVQRLNVVTLMSLTWHILYLARHFHTNLDTPK